MEQWLGQFADVPYPEMVRGMLRDGVGVHLCEPEAASQQRHPRHAQIIAGGAAMLRRGMTNAAAQQALMQRAPPPVRLPNHSSARQHADFITNELSHLQVTGAVRQTTALGFSFGEQGRFDAAVVVHPLAVVVQSSGKLRLILDASRTCLQDMNH